MTRSLNKGSYPEYYTFTQNHTLGCHECHSQFDDDIGFRKKQEHLYKQAAAFDKLAADKYFRKNG
jgi:hypothetical protein